MLNTAHSNRLSVVIKIGALLSLCEIALNKNYRNSEPHHKINFNM